MSKHWTTTPIHFDVRVPEGFRSLATPVYRGSTASTAAPPVRFETLKMMLTPVCPGVMLQTRLC
jgi:hypothetical protein